MGLDPRRELLRLLLALLLGFALGFVYDVLRPPRRRFGRAVAALLDLLFGLLAAIAAFLFAMSAGEGRLGLWELTASLLGFLLYLHSLSPLFYPLLTALLETLCSIMESTKKFCVNLQISAKKIFQNVRKCFIVKR